MSSGTIRAIHLAKAVAAGLACAVGLMAGPKNHAPKLLILASATRLAAAIVCGALLGNLEAESSPLKSSGALSSSSEAREGSQAGLLGLSGACGLQTSVARSLMSSSSSPATIAEENRCTRCLYSSSFARGLFFRATAAATALSGLTTVGVLDAPGSRSQRIAHALQDNPCSCEEGANFCDYDFGDTGEFDPCHDYLDANERFINGVPAPASGSWQVLNSFFDCPLVPFDENLIRVGSLFYQTNPFSKQVERVLVVSTKVTAVCVRSIHDQPTDMGIDLVRNLGGMFTVEVSQSTKDGDITTSHHVDSTAEVIEEPKTSEAKVNYTESQRKSPKNVSQSGDLRKSISNSSLCFVFLYVTLIIDFPGCE